MLAFTASNITAIIHWIFAIAYFELALKFEMVLGHIKSDIERQFKQKNKVIFLLNVLFFAFIIANSSCYFMLHRYYLVFSDIALLA